MNLSHLLFPLILLVASAFSAPQALAETPSKPVPVVSVTAAVGYGMNMKSGAALPPVIIHGAAVLVPIGNGWSYGGEVAVATTFSEFKPGLQLITGPVKKLGDKVSLGVTGMYKVQPVYDGVSPPMHIVSVSVAPIFKTSFGVLSLPVSIVHNASTKDPGIIGLAIKASAPLKSARAT